MKGIIFDIREFTVHDGPGSRITVFLKGCPLRCKWCHNPEGLRTERQLMYRDALCTHCGTCFRPCRHPECKPFGRCIHACPNGCLDIAGEEIAPPAVGAAAASARRNGKGNGRWNHIFGRGTHVSAGLCPGTGRLSTGFPQSCSDQWLCRYENIPEGR